MAATILGAVGCAAIVAAFLLALQYRRIRAWKEVARRLGLAFSSSGFFRRTEVTGRIGELGIRLHFKPRGKLEDAVLEVDAQHLVAHSLTLGREDAFLNQFRGGDIELASADFDARVRIGGDEALVLAVLDRDIRRLVLQVIVEAQADLAQGVLRSADVTFCGADEVVALVEAFVSLVTALAIDPSEVPARLAAHAREEPEPGVRLRNLRVLLAHYARLPGAAATCRALLDDPVPEIALEAAVHLARGGDEAARARLGRVADDEGSDHVVRARAMAELGGPDVEARLIAWLDLADARATSAAIDALGRVGSVAAIVPLRRHIAVRAIDAGVARAARAAIVQIQARLPGARPGQLSLDGDPGAGALSASAAPTGSLSEPQDGRGEGGDVEVETAR